MNGRTLCSGKSRVDGSARVAYSTAMRTAPVITFIIAVRNCVGTLQRCLDSIYAQTSPAWEIVVIDGGSTDGTLGILERNSARLAYWVSEPDRGIYDAWNKALPHVRGEWFHFLGADDRLWDEQVVERALPPLGSAWPAHSIVYGRIGTATIGGAEAGELGEPWEAVRERFSREMCIPHPGVFHHRSLIDGGRQFDITLPFAGDYDFLLAVIRERPPLFLPDLKVAVWELGGATSSPRHALAVFRDMRRIHERHGIAAGGGRHWRFAKAWAKSACWRLLGPDITAAAIDVWRRLTGRRALGRLDR